MASQTITHRTNPDFTGTIAGVTFTNGTGTADDTTSAGKRAIAFFTRRGWSVGATAETAQTVDQGKPVSKWTKAELAAYLDENHVEYPADADKPALLRAVQDAYETKSQGGSAANKSAGRESETMSVEGAPFTPGDDTATAEKYATPITGPAAP